MAQKYIHVLHTKAALRSRDCNLISISISTVLMIQLLLFADSGYINTLKSNQLHLRGGHTHILFFLTSFIFTSLMFLLRLLIISCFSISTSSCVGKDRMVVSCLAWRCFCCCRKQARSSGISFLRDSRPSISVPVYRRQYQSHVKITLKYNKSQILSFCLV